MRIRRVKVLCKSGEGWWYDSYVDQEVDIDLDDVESGVPARHKGPRLAATEHNAKLFGFQMTGCWIAWDHMRDMTIAKTNKEAKRFLHS